MTEDYTIPSDIPAGEQTGSAPAAYNRPLTTTLTTPAEEQQTEPNDNLERYNQIVSFLGKGAKLSAKKTAEELTQSDLDAANTAYLEKINSHMESIGAEPFSNLGSVDFDAIAKKEEEYNVKNANENLKKARTKYPSLGNVPDFTSTKDINERLDALNKNIEELNSKESVSEWNKRASELRNLYGIEIPTIKSKSEIYAAKTRAEKMIKKYNETAKIEGQKYGVIEKIPGGKQWIDWAKEASKKMNMPIPAIDSKEGLSSAIKTFGEGVSRYNKEHPEDVIKMPEQQYGMQYRGDIQAPNLPQTTQFQLKREKGIFERDKKFSELLQYTPSSDPSIGPLVTSNDMSVIKSLAPKDNEAQSAGYIDYFTYNTQMAKSQALDEEYQKIKEKQRQGRATQEDINRANLLASEIQSIKNKYKESDIEAHHASKSQYLISRSDDIQKRASSMMAEYAPLQKKYDAGQATPQEINRMKSLSSDIQKMNEASKLLHEEAVENTIQLNEYLPHKGTFGGGLVRTMGDFMSNLEKSTISLIGSAVSRSLDLPQFNPEISKNIDKHLKEFREDMDRRHEEGARALGTSKEYVEHGAYSDVYGVESILPYMITSELTLPMMAVQGFGSTQQALEDNKNLSQGEKDLISALSGIASASVMHYLPKVAKGDALVRAITYDAISSGSANLGLKQAGTYIEKKVSDMASNVVSSAVSFPAIMTASGLAEKGITDIANLIKGGFTVKESDGIYSVYNKDGVIVHQTDNKADAEYYANAIPTRSWKEDFTGVVSELTAGKMKDVRLGVYMGLIGGVIGNIQKSKFNRETFYDAYKMVSRKEGFITMQNQIRQDLADKKITVSEAKEKMKSLINFKNMVSKIPDFLSEDAKKISRIATSDYFDNKLRDVNDRLKNNKITKEEAKNEASEINRERKAYEIADRRSREKAFEAWRLITENEELELEKAKYHEAFRGPIQKRIDANNEKLKDISLRDDQAYQHEKNKWSLFSNDINQDKTNKSVVSIFPERNVKLQGPVTQEDIYNFKEANRDLLKGNEDVLSVGTWIDKDGVNNIDISVVVPHAEANELARSYNQKTTFNLEKGTESYTGATGEATEEMKSEADRVKDIRELVGRTKATEADFKPIGVEEVTSRLGEKHPMVRAVNNAMSALTKLPGFSDNNTIKVRFHDSHASMQHAMNTGGARQLDAKSTKGSFSYTRNSKGGYDITIDFNLKKGTGDATIRHEFTHGILLHAFGENPEMFQKMKDAFRSYGNMFNDSNLVKFADMYDKSATAEEYLAELSAISKNIKPGVLSRIAEFINNVSAKYLGDKFVPFKDVNDANDIIRYFGSLSNAVRTGKPVEIREMKKQVEKEIDPEVLENGLSTNIGEPSPIKEIDVKSKQSLSFPKKPLPLSFVTDKDIVDMDDILKDIYDNGKTVWFWMADQLGRGMYRDEVLNGEHYLDAGPSFALDPENKNNEVLWASGLSVKYLSESAEKADYIFFISGSPEKAKMFNKAVLDLVGKRIDAGIGFDKFKKGVKKFGKKTEALSTMIDILDKYNSFKDIVNSTDRKPFLLAIDEIRQLKTTPKGSIKQFLEKSKAIVNPNELRDGFYKDNGFEQNDIMLIGKPTGAKEGSSHGTYLNTVLGEVIGVPGKKINAWELMPEDVKKKYPKAKVSQKAKIIAAEMGKFYEGKGEERELAPKEPKSKQQLVADKKMIKKMTEDEDGNYLFYHYSPSKIAGKIDPRFFGRNPKTGRDERPGIGISMYYTRPDYRDVGGNYGYVVRVPKDKVYPFNEDPLNLYDKAEATFQKMYPGQAFDPNKQVAFIAQEAAKLGYDMTVAKWGDQLRAQTTKPMKGEWYEKPHPEYRYSPVYNPKLEGFQANEKKPKSKQQLDEWEESRIGKGDRAITDRNENVKNAAEEYYQGNIDIEEYNKIVDKNSEIRPITSFIKPAKEEDITKAVGEKSKSKVNLDFEEGKRVGLRLDIPAYIRHNIWAITVHENGKQGISLSYNNVARIKNVEFISDPTIALDIARHKLLSSGERMGKATIARMMGDWVPIEGETSEDKGVWAMNMVDEIKNNPEWSQIGMNPFRHSYFYDRATKKPVIAADEVIQIGGLVYAKNVKTTSIHDERFTVYTDKQRTVPLIGKGGVKSKFRLSFGDEVDIEGVDVKIPEEKDQDVLKADRSTKKYFDDKVQEMRPSSLSKDELKKLLDSDNMAILTGTNPDGNAVDDKTNDSLNKKAEEWLKENNYKYHEVTGKYGQTESSFIVEGMTAAEAMDFAERFKQDSVAHSEGLVYRKGAINRRDNSGDEFGVDVTGPEEDFVSAIKTKDGEVVGFKIGYDFDKEEEYNPEVKSKQRLDEEEIRDKMDKMFDVYSKKMKDRPVEEIVNRVIRDIQHQWIPEGSQVEFENAVRQFKKDNGIKIKPAPSQEKISGQKPSTVTVKESTALKDQIKLEARAAREGAKSIEDFIRSVSEGVKSMVGRGVITANQASAITKRMAFLNPKNAESVDKFYKWVDKIFSNADYADKLKEASTNRDKIKGKLNSKEIPPGLVKIAKKFSKIDPSEVSDIDEYNEMSKMLWEGLRPNVMKKDKYGNIVESKREAVNMEDMNRYIESQEDAMQKKKEKAEKEAEEDPEIIQKLQDSIDQLSDIARTILETGINPIDGTSVDLTSKEKSILKKFLDMKPKEKKTLMDTEYALKHFIENGDTGLMEYARERYDIDRKVETGINALKRATGLGIKRLPVEWVVSAVRSLKNIIPSKYQESMRDYQYLTNSSISRIDTLVRNIEKGSPVFKALFRDIAAGYSFYKNKTKEMNPEKIYQKMLKGLNGDIKKAAIAKYKITMYLGQLEHESNPGSSKSLPAMDYMKAVIEAAKLGTNKMNKYSRKVLEKLIQEYSYTDADGVQHIDKDKIYDSLSEPEKNAVSEIQKLYRDLLPFAKTVAEKIRNNPFDEILNYVSIAVNDSSLSAADISTLATEMQNYLPSSLSTKAGQLEDRTGVARSIDMDPFSTANKAVRNILLDYSMTSNIMALRRITKDFREESVNGDDDVRLFAIALDNVSNEVIKSVIGRSYMERTTLSEAMDLLTRKSVTFMLAGLEKITKETGSNMAFAAAFAPAEVANGAKYMKYITSGRGGKILEVVNSYNQDRLYPHGGDIGKVADTESYDISISSSQDIPYDAQMIAFKAYYNTLNRAIKVGRAATEAMLSGPDIAMARPLWFGSMAIEFKRITGKEIDFDKIENSDAEYLESNMSAIEQARDVADKNVIDAANTKNPFLRSPKLTIGGNNKQAAQQLWSQINTFLSGFSRKESEVLIDSIDTLYREGQITRTQAVKTIAAVTARAATYRIIGIVMARILSSAGVYLSTLVNDDEDDKLEAAIRKNLSKDASKMEVEAAQIEKDYFTKYSPKIEGIDTSINVSNRFMTSDEEAVAKMDKRLRPKRTLLEEGLHGAATGTAQLLLNRNFGNLQNSLITAPLFEEYINSKYINNKDYNKYEDQYLVSGLPSSKQDLGTELLSKTTGPFGLPISGGIELVKEFQEMASIDNQLKDVNNKLKDIDAGTPVKEFGSREKGKLEIDKKKLEERYEKGKRIVATKISIGAIASLSSIPALKDIVKVAKKASEDVIIKTTDWDKLVKSYEEAQKQVKGSTIPAGVTPAFNRQPQQSQYFKMTSKGYKLGPKGWYK